MQIFVTDEFCQNFNFNAYKKNHVKLPLMSYIY